MVEKDLVREGDLWKTQAGEVLEEVSESNYVFEISSEVRKEVKQWAENSVFPSTAQNKVLDDLER